MPPHEKLARHQHKPVTTGTAAANKGPVHAAAPKSGAESRTQAPTEQTTAKPGIEA